MLAIGSQHYYRHSPDVISAGERPAITQWRISGADSKGKSFRKMIFRFYYCCYLYHVLKTNLTSEGRMMVSTTTVPLLLLLRNPKLQVARFLHLLLPVAVWIVSLPETWPRSDCLRPVACLVPNLEIWNRPTKCEELGGDRIWENQSKPCVSKQIDYC